MEIQRRLTLGFIVFGFAVVTASHGLAADPQDRLAAYGKQIASSTEQHAVVFVTVVKTTETPLRAYQIKFKTNHQALMAERNAERDQKAYLINRGKTEAWQQKFCTPELKTIMQVFGIDLVSGDFANMKGETQSMAVCGKN